MDSHRKNEYIKAETVLLIDEEGEKLGEVSTKEALKLATDKGLDLIEVAPNSKPPVAKIMSWSKYKYEQDKKRKESKSKSIDLKEMWFKAFISEGDLDHKLKKVREFLEKKHPVKLLIIAKGRVHNEHLTDLIDRILIKLEDIAEVQSTPKRQGRNLGVIVIPKKK